MANQIVIREATPGDASNVMRLLLEWHGTAMIEYPAPREIDVLKWVTRLFENGGHVVVAERSREEQDLRKGPRSGRLVGAMGMEPRVFEWNRAAWYFGDAFFYVNSFYRRMGAASALLKAARLHAAARKIPLVMAIITGNQPEKLERYYNINGGIYAGGIMTFGLPTQEISDVVPLRQRQ